MSRRLARRTVLQTLYQLDLAKLEIAEALESRLADTNFAPKDQEFVETVVRGVWNHRSEIDSLINQFATDWRVERMSYVDRNILRLAIWELKYADHAPVKVIVNEAVELAKLFSDEVAARFINGILGSVIAHLGVKEYD